MTTDLPGSQEPDQDDDEAVLLYLAALETRRTAPDTLPHPDAAATNLARADMVGGRQQDDLQTSVSEGEEHQIETQLAEGTPGAGGDIRRLEEGFVNAAAAYGKRHGLNYEGWLQAGVDADVLRRAGIEPPAR